MYFSHEYLFPFHNGNRAGLKKPVVGMHFFNPAPVMKLVEIITGIDTPAETVQILKTIAEDIGKVPVQVKETAGLWSTEFLSL